MPTFSNRTIKELIDALALSPHERIDDFIIEFELDAARATRDIGGLYPRSSAIKRYLIGNPDRIGPDGGNIVLEIIEYFLRRAEQGQVARAGRSWGEPESLETLYPALVHTLRRDGFEIDGTKLRRVLPEVAALAQSENELVSLLDAYGFSVPKGHYEQATAAFARGDWASANAMLRSFVESLFDEIAYLLRPAEAQTRTSSHGRRELLASMTPPFFLSPYNEWVSGGGQPSFVQGLWARLHPHGSHLGLSDEEDCTFRMQIVMLTASHYMRRLRQRMPTV